MLLITVLFGRGWRPSPGEGVLGGPGEGMGVRGLAQLGRNAVQLRRWRLKPPAPPEAAARL